MCDFNIKIITFAFLSKFQVGSGSPGSVPELYELDVWYLSVPGNFIHAEHSVSQYIWLMLRSGKNFTDENLALHVGLMMVVSARSW